MSRKTLKTQRKLKKKTKTYKKGGYKEMLCSQAIVSQARANCWKKCKTKKYVADEKALVKMKKQYEAFLSKMCKAEHYDCIQTHREGNPLFDKIITLENKIGKNSDECIRKHCTKEELNRLDTCIDLGEEQCRVKYADLIKKSKKKILPLEVCMRN